MRQRVIVPVRCYEEDINNEICYIEFDRLVLDLPLFNNNTLLITLLDDNEEHRLALKGIKFKFYEGENNSFIKKKKKDYPSFITDYIDYFLVIEIEFNHKKHAGDTFYADAYLARLGLLITITYGTSIVFLRGIVIEKDLLIGRTSFVQNSIDFAYRHAFTIKWPVLPGLKLIEVLNWLNDYKIKFYSSSKSPASRALNALSHIFNKDLSETDTAHLFWCMLGIEALFSKGSNGISDQIREKIKLVLGEPAEFKKKLTKLYGYRSRLIHGDIDFPAKFSIDHKNFEMEYWDYTAFATSLLLASIKGLIENNIDHFTFDYQWKKP
ncbi:MAG: hypothetical protein V4577_30365 [Bacteroidota bacterium]